MTENYRALREKENANGVPRDLIEARDAYSNELRYSFHGWLPVSVARVRVVRNSPPMIWSGALMRKARRRTTKVVYRSIPRGRNNNDAGQRQCIGHKISTPIGLRPAWPVP